MLACRLYVEMGFSNPSGVLERPLAAPAPSLWIVHQWLTISHVYTTVRSEQQIDILMEIIAST